MKIRGTLILLGIFVALLVFIYLFEIKGGAKREEQTKLENLLFKIKQPDVTKVELRSTADHLICEKENDQWSITFPFDAEVDKSSIESNLRSLIDTKIERKITDKLTDLAPYGLDKPRGEVVLSESDTSSTRLLVGSENPTGSFVFVKFPETPDIYTIPKSFWTYISKKIYDLRDKKIMHFAVPDVRKIEVLSQEKGFVVLNKVGDEWKIVQPFEIKTKDIDVTSFLNRLHSGNAKSFIEELPENFKPYGLDDPFITVNLYIGEGFAKSSFFIGDTSKAEENRYFAREESRRPVFTVDKWLVENLNKGAFDFQDKKLVTFDEENIDRLECSIDQIPFVCEKLDTLDEWTITSPETLEVKSGTMTSWLNGMRDFSADELETYKPKRLGIYGFDSPEVKITLYEKGSEIGTILIGKEVEESYYVKSGDEPFVYRVKSSKVNRVRKTPDDLKKETS